VDPGGRIARVAAGPVLAKPIVSPALNQDAAAMGVNVDTVVIGPEFTGLERCAFVSRRLRGAGEREEQQACRCDDGCDFEQLSQVEV